LTNICKKLLTSSRTPPLVVYRRFTWNGRIDHFTQISFVGTKIANNLPPPWRQYLTAFNSAEDRFHNAAPGHQPRHHSPAENSILPLPRAGVPAGAEPGCPHQRLRRVVHFSDPPFPGISRQQRLQ